DALFHERYLLSSLLDSARDAIYFKDARGRIIRANAPLAHRAGFSDPRALVGKRLAELANKDELIACDQQDDIVIRTGAAQYERLETRITEGRVKWDIATRRPLRDTDGHIVGSIGTLRDVTEQKEAQENIQEAVRRRDQFLAMLSHELRNPLGALVTATSLLGDSKDGVTGERRKRLLGIVERQSAQMARLLDDPLEVSRVTQNKIELRKEIVDIGAI